MRFYQRRKPPSSLRITRILRGYLQAEIAGRCGVSQSYFSRLEVGRERPSLALRRKLSRVLGLPAAVLFPPEDGAGD